MTSTALTSVSNKTLPSVPQTAANTFFHNPDLCTLFAKTLLHVSITLPSTTIPCQTTHFPATNPLLTFRSITRSAYNAVMLEHPTRVALGLEPQAQSALGVVVMPPPEGPEYEPTYTAHMSHSETYNATLLALEIEDSQGEEEEDQQQGRKEYVQSARLFHDSQRRHARRHPSPRLARIFTHHPATSHTEKYTSANGTILHLTSEDFSLCSGLPLARDMFLTQPPQKSIAFRVRYEYSPGTRRGFTLRNEAGIRFGDLVEFFEREPGIMKRAVDPKGGLGRYRRWLRDGEFVWMNLVEWEVGRGAVRGGGLWRWAHDDVGSNEMRKRVDGCGDV